MELFYIPMRAIVIDGVRAVICDCTTQGAVNIDSQSELIASPFEHPLHVASYF
jgi:hypothetical protein